MKALLTAVWSSWQKSLFSISSVRRNVFSYKISSCSSQLSSKSAYSQTNWSILQMWLRCCDSRLSLVMLVFHICTVKLSITKTSYSFQLQMFLDKLCFNLIMISVKIHSAKNFSLLLTQSELKYYFGINLTIQSCIMFFDIFHGFKILF